MVSSEQDPPGACTDEQGALSWAGPAGWGDRGKEVRCCVKREELVLCVPVVYVLTLEPSER